MDVRIIEVYMLDVLVRVSEFDFLIAYLSLSWADKAVKFFLKYVLNNKALQIAQYCCHFFNPKSPKDNFEL